MNKLQSMLEEGHRFHPLTGKRPIFKNWQNSQPDQQTLKSWIEDSRYSIGWIMESVAAIDFDELSLARDFWKTHGPFRCAIQVTPRPGCHLIFRQPGHIGNRVNVLPSVDWRGIGGYIKVYKFVEGFDTTDPTKLDPFPEHLFPANRPQLVSKEIKNIRAYLARIESIQGSNGSAGLVRAVARLRDAGLSQAEALLELLRWNEGPTVQPSWTHEALARVITRIYRK